MIHNNYNNKATFAVIGKPNNGKSTIISTLTFDDRIEIEDEIGTTKKSIKYSYKYNNQEICTYFDTPGFEKAKEIRKYIKNKEKDIISIKQILEDFIDEYSDDERMMKDREILKAITQSDFLVFIIDISKNFNKATIASELEIFKKLEKRTVVLFNQLDKEKDYSSIWENQLKEYNLTNIHKINPLNSQYSNIISILNSLYSIDSEIYYKQQLDDVIRTFKIHRKQNLEMSSNLISQYLRDVLQTEVNIKREDDNSNKALNTIQNKINQKEKAIQKELSQLWGYYQVKVEDKREKYYHKINKTITLSKTEKSLAAAIIFASISGTATGLLSGGVAAPTGAMMGFAGGALVGYFSDGKLYEINMLKKDLKVTVSPKDINLSIILITRILEFLKTIINHGHPNRDTLIISKIEKRDFTVSEIKEISIIHKSFVNDKNSDEYIPKLQKIILDILKQDNI